jgi:hypothetical protein
MAESRREGPQVQKEIERPSESDRQHTMTGNGGSGGEAAQRQTEVARGGVRQATEASKAVAGGAFRSGEALAEGAQEITAAWTRYAEEVMRHTSEASQALLRARTFK